MRRVLTVLISIVVLAGAVPTQAHTGYTLASLKGRWGFFEEFRTGDRYGTSVGVVRFDGAGNCTIEQVTNGGTTTQATEYQTDCTYTLERGGRGTLTGGQIADYAISLADHGTKIIFIHNEERVVGRGEMRPVGTGAVQAEDLTGRWALIHPAEVGGLYETSIGIYRFDGVEECSGEFQVNGGASTRPRGESAKCTYQVASDGLGELSSGDRFVVTDGGSFIYLIHGAPYNVGWAELTRV